jgi:hypothetical protein
MRLFFLVLFFIFLPHGEVTGTRQSSLDPETRQNPTIENIPDGDNTDQDED